MTMLNGEILCFEIDHKDKFKSSKSLTKCGVSDNRQQAVQSGTIQIWAIAWRNTDVGTR
jgi:hypothetical protein